MATSESRDWERVTERLLWCMYFSHVCASGTGSQRALLSWTGVTKPLQSWMHVWMSVMIRQCSHLLHWLYLRDFLVILVSPCLTSLRCMGHSTELKPRKPNEFHLIAVHSGWRETVAFIKLISFSGCAWNARPARNHRANDLLAATHPFPSYPLDFVWSFLLPALLVVPFFWLLIQPNRCCG